MAAVLVVDDQRVVRALVRDILEMAGHEVTEAVDGRSALEAVNTRTPDLIVCDLNLPDGRGSTVIHQLGPSHTRPPVLYLSGDDQGLAEVELGPRDRCLGKPFGVGELMGVVEGMVGGVGAAAALDRTWVTLRYGLKGETPVN